MRQIDFKELLKNAEPISSEDALKDIPSSNLDTDILNGNKKICVKKIDKIEGREGYVKLGTYYSYPKQHS
jgi:hypothetical protein